MTGPNPNSVYPNENIRQVVYIKNVISRPNILVGDYTYYDDIDGAEKFEEHVTHHYDFLGDRLIIGKFCAIARGIEFIIVYYERREPPHEQRNDLPLQHHGRRLGEVCPKAR